LLDTEGIIEGSDDKEGSVDGSSEGISVGDDEMLGAFETDG